MGKLAKGAITNGHCAVWMAFGAMRFAYCTLRLLGDYWVSTNSSASRLGPSIITARVSPSK